MRPNASRRETLADMPFDTSLKMVPDANRPAELSISPNIDEPQLPVVGQGVDRHDIAARSEIALANV
jgi:hypothetical protein